MPFQENKVFVSHKNTWSLISIDENNYEINKSSFTLIGKKYIRKYLKRCLKGII